MEKLLQELKFRIEPYQRKLINHQLYSSINNIEDIKLFMNSHVFAVWDFMSLLKSLQFEFTSNKLPWFPVSSPENRFLINDIVLGEESDIDELGNRTSHFEMYLSAMEEVGASTNQMRAFIRQLKLTNDFDWSFKCINAPKAIIDFVNYTFKVVYSSELHIKVAVFTYGREDIIPNMFYQLVQNLNEGNPGQLSKFLYYLKRHIELDGGLHKFMAEKMLINVCGHNSSLWEEATFEAIKALNRRIELWDYIHLALKNNNSKMLAN